MNLIENENTDEVIRHLRHRNISDSLRGDYLCKAVQSENIALTRFFLNHGPISKADWAKALKIAKENDHPEIAALLSPCKKYTRIAWRALSAFIESMTTPLGEFGAAFTARIAESLVDRMFVNRVL